MSGELRREQGPRGEHREPEQRTLDKLRTPEVERAEQERNARLKDFRLRFGRLRGDVERGPW